VLLVPFSHQPLRLSAERCVRRWHKYWVHFPWNLECPESQIGDQHPGRVQKIPSQAHCRHRSCWAMSQAILLRLSFQIGGDSVEYIENWFLKTHPPQLALGHPSRHQLEMIADSLESLPPMPVLHLEKQFLPDRR
jgi:hypothetical protein